MSDTGAKHEAEIHVIDASSVKSWSSYDMEAARTSTVPRGPAGVSFRLDGPPEREGQTVTVRGLLVNAGRTAVTITVFPAGPLGFYLDAAYGSGKRKPLPPGQPPLPMQAPPPPLLIELPPKTAVRVFNYVLLDDFDWTPGVQREIEWSYEFWNEPKPTGRVRVP
jgi:hypothetical protein